jgi:hypothetical protein
LSLEGRSGSESLSLRFVGKERATAQADAEQEKRIKQSSQWSDARVVAAIVFVTQGWRKACL